jgi:hypothetical protein
LYQVHNLQSIILADTDSINPFELYDLKLDDNFSGLGSAVTITSGPVTASAPFGIFEDVPRDIMRYASILDGARSQTHSREGRWGLFGVRVIWSPNGEVLDSDVLFRFHRKGGIRSNGE